MRCPKCGEEFAFPRGKIEEERQKLVLLNQEAINHLQELKGLPKALQTPQTWRERKRWTKQFEETKTRLSEIKALIRQTSEPITSDLFHLYREMVKDRYGTDIDEVFMKWAKENLEAYKISDISAHDFYTRKGGQIIKKV